MWLGLKSNQLTGSYSAHWLQEFVQVSYHGCYLLASFSAKPGQNVKSIMRVNIGKKLLQEYHQWQLSLLN